jgi:phage antirepressor YoqD-like protein
MLPAVTSGQPATMSSNDLIDIINKSRLDNGEKTIRRNDFTSRIRDELEGDHYETIVVENPNGTTSDVLLLTRDQCMYVSMRESKSVRRHVTKMLNESHEPPAFKIPQTYAAALRLCAEQAEAIEAQQAQLLIAAPKAAFVDAYVDSTGLKGFRQVAKLIGANEAQFREFLIDNKIMYRLGGEWVAYQNHIDAGRFSVKTGEANGHAFTQSKFTPKGVTWVAGEWGKHKVSADKAED